jgi:hypothetical protein
MNLKIENTPGGEFDEIRTQINNSTEFITNISSNSEITLRSLSNQNPDY